MILNWKRTAIAVLMLFVSTQSQATPHLVRQWTRSTLLQPHLGFRYLNRMEPILTEELVVQGNGVNGISAYHRKSGNRAWQLELKNGVEGGATLSGSKLYFGSNDGSFYCIDVNSGAILWSYKVNSESLTYPLVKGAFVYHLTGNNVLYAFNKDTGESAWVKTNAAKANMTVRGQTAPVFENGKIFVGFSDGNFVAINGQNGRELWSKRIGDDKKFNDVDATAVITPQCILVSSFANSLYCLNKNDGAIQWRHDSGGYSAVTVIENRIYYPTSNGEIHLLDLESGKLIRKIVNVKGLATQIAEMGPYIVYGETAGALIFREKESLDQVTSFNPGLGIYAEPKIDNEKKQIYFISNDANLYRLDLKVKLDQEFLWSQKRYE